MSFWTSKTSKMATGTDGRRHVSAALCISWAGSSHRTRAKSCKGWIINRHRAIWRAVRSHFINWVLQYHWLKSTSESCNWYMKDVLRKNRPVSPVLLFILPHLLLSIFHAFNFLPQNIVSTGTTATISGIIVFSHVFKILYHYSV